MRIAKSWRRNWKRSAPETGRSSRMVLFGIGDEEEDCPAHDEDETDFSHVLDYVACQLTVKVSGSRAQVRETSWTTACCSRGSEKPELRDDVPSRSGEPDVAVGIGGKPRGAKPPLCRRLRDHPCCGDPPDLVADVFGEPQVPVWPGRDVVRVAVGGGDGELSRDDPSRGDPPDHVAEVCGEQQAPVRSGGDPQRARVGG